jgi:hypothetical protein
MRNRWGGIVEERSVCIRRNIFKGPGGNARRHNN